MNGYSFDYLNYITNVPNNMSPSNMDMNQYSNNQYSDMNQTKYINQQNNFFNENNKVNMPYNKNAILEPYQGFIRGNMFENLYDPYKNYKPAKLNPTNEKEALLYQLLQYNFALADLNLYLDTHPNDQEAINLYKKYLEIKKQICNKYETAYGPLTTDGILKNTTNWNWINGPWPWEGV